MANAEVVVLCLQALIDWLAPNRENSEDALVRAAQEVRSKKRLQEGNVEAA